MTPHPQRGQVVVGQFVLEAAEAEDLIGELMVLRSGLDEPDPNFWASGETLTKADDGHRLTSVYARTPTVQDAGVPFINSHWPNKTNCWWARLRTPFMFPVDHVTVEEAVSTQKVRTLLVPSHY